MNPADASAAGRHVREEAARWAVRLEGDPLEPAERRALDIWLAADPAHRLQLSRHCQLSADLERQLPALVAAGAVDPMLVAIAARRSPWRRLAPWAGLAAAAIVLSVAWPRPGLREIATRPAQRQAIALADGTRADVNARTSLRVDFSETRRRLVRLDRGEALFTVAKDPARPFVVETPGGQVRVTGTTFNVLTDPAGRLEVAVLEGSVEVVPQAGAALAAAPLALVSGDRVTLDRVSFSVQRDRPGAAAQATAWRDGWLVFERAALADVLRRFADYHGREITVAPEAAGELLSGRFGLDDLDGFLFADLERALPSVRVARRPGGGAHVARR